MLRSGWSARRSSIAMRRPAASSRTWTVYRPSIPMNGETKKALSIEATKRPPSRSRAERVEVPLAVGVVDLDDDDSQAPASRQRKKLAGLKT